MNQQEMFGSAQWLGFDGKTRTPVVRASFTAAQTAKAEIVICGLGYFELYLNGQRVSEDLFVRCCAPTLAGIKAGSMFSYQYESKEEMREDIRRLNRAFVTRGLIVLPLRYHD